MKIGILGGSFNPVHNGHVRMAIEVLERLSLDRVELVPAKQPPHKQEGDILPFDLRLELVNQAIDGVPGLGSNPLEGEREGPSYTCDTLNCYRTEQPDSDFFFIVGRPRFWSSTNGGEALRFLPWRPLPWSTDGMLPRPWPDSSRRTGRKRSRNPRASGSSLKGIPFDSWTFRGLISRGGTSVNGGLSVEACGFSFRPVWKHFLKIIPQKSRNIGENAVSPFRRENDLMPTFR